MYVSGLGNNRQCSKDVHVTLHVKIFRRFPHRMQGCRPEEFRLRWRSHKLLLDYWIVSYIWSIALETEGIECFMTLSQAVCPAASSRVCQLLDSMLSMWGFPKIGDPNIEP